MATARVERRLAAILAADVVGYSRLVEQDETGTLSALHDLRREVIDPLLAEHHGRIVKLMGDGLIAEFGSVVDAVACAIALQKGLAQPQINAPADRRIVFRIGINLGDVVVEGDLLGDGVNIAARLEQICPPGGVMISGTAYDHLQGKLDILLHSLASSGSRTSTGQSERIGSILVGLRRGRHLGNAADCCARWHWLSCSCSPSRLVSGSGAPERPHGFPAPLDRRPSVRDLCRRRGDEPLCRRPDRGHHR